MRARVVSPPVNVTGLAETQRPRRQVCAVTSCKYVAQTDGRCWTHRADMRKLRIVARLAAGMSPADVAAELGIPMAVVQETRAAGASGPRGVMP